MKAQTLEGDFFHALVLFQIKAVAFVTAPKRKEERAERARAVTAALAKLSVHGFEQFAAKMVSFDVAGLGCDDGYVLCHGVCQPPENCYNLYYAVPHEGVPMAGDKNPAGPSDFTPID